MPIRDEIPVVGVIRSIRRRLPVALLTVIVLLAWTSCRGEKPDVDALTEQVPLTPRYLALGDSYTVGEGVRPTERFPSRVATRLQLAEPVLIARTGWTVRDLDTGMYEAKLRSTDYALVTLLIGANDEVRGNTLEHYREDFAEIYARAVEHARGEPARVFVISIPDYSVTPWGQEHDAAATSARIGEFNGVAREIAEAGGSTFVDITDITRDNAQMLVSDGLHPSAEQYELWAERIASAIGEVTP